MITTITYNGLTFRVRILETRRIYGRDEVKITPVAGSGEKWVRAEKIKEEAPHE